jgi:hypothetical protein
MIQDQQAVLICPGIRHATGRRVAAIPMSLAGQTEFCKERPWLTEDQNGENKATDVLMLHLILHNDNSSQF